MRLLLVLAIVLGLAGGAGADPCGAAGARCDEPTVPAVVARPLASPALPTLDPPPSMAGRPQDEAPSHAGAVLRLLGSVVIVALLLVAGVTGYRKLVQHAAARPGGMLGWVARAAEDRDPDLVRIGSRRYLGARDSVAVVHAGGERFLVGISAAGISLISRLESPAVEAEPSPATFGDALSRAAAAPASEGAPLAERALRAAVERSRARLARLGPLATVHEDPRA